MKALSATFFALLGLSGLPALAEEPRLRIALTNDDGWQAEGIQALFRSFEGAGHDVMLAAPADQQSGSSAAFNLGKLRVVREAEAQFSVHACVNGNCTSGLGAEPATSALIAIDLVRREHDGADPHLLISGVNEGANLGSATQLSGTVGAAVAASSRTMNGPVPAIAVSTDVPQECGDDLICESRHYQRVGRFMVQLVAHLAAGANDAPMLPGGLVLNVNYPAAQAKGVRVVAQDPALAINGTTIRFNFGCESCVDLAVGEAADAAMTGFSPDAVELPSHGELESFADGYVTVVPMQIDYTADNYIQYADLVSGIELGE